MCVFNRQNFKERFNNLININLKTFRDSEIFVKLKEKSANLAYLLMNHHKIFSFADKELAKYGWIVNDSISYRDYQDIAALINNSAEQREIDDKFLELYFDDEFSGLKYCLENIEKNLYVKEGNNLRFQIIKDCFEIVINNNNQINPYSLAIPVLLAHTERLKDDFINYIKNVFPEDFVIENGKSKPKKKQIESKALERIKDIDIIQFYQHSIDYIMNTVFQNSHDVKPEDGINISESNILNRHRILHGDILKYGTKENFLRCCLVLELLSNLFNEEKLKFENE